MDTSRIPGDWQKKLAEEFDKPYFKELKNFLEEERRNHTIYPPEKEVFAALQATEYLDTNVLILGQDPYHGKGQAHGLCFSVPSGIKHPPSLRNIFRELKDDLGYDIPKNGDLTSWAKQGVLLLNAVLTVRAGEANSHKDKGWEKFTDEIIRILNAKNDSLIFVLWGKYAQKKQALIDSEKHLIITAPHPSPFSAHHGFFGSKPFSTINSHLKSLKKKQIDWKLS